MTQTKDLIKKMADFFKSEEYYEKGENARLELTPNDARCVIQLIKAQPKTGHWTPYKNEADVYKCTACGAIVYEYPTSWNYCPWCCARIEQEPCDVPDINDGKMSENPTSSKPEISSYYGLKSYVRERSDKE